MAVKRTFRNAHIIWKNFRGEKGPYNTNGDKSFAILINDPALAEELREEGWVLKELASNDDYDSVAYALKVKVRFDKRPPKCKLITNIGGRQKQTILDENTISSLDWAEPEKIDLTISQSNWSMNGRTGVTAYLDVMYFTPVVDELEAEYADPDDFPTEDGEELPF